jgi:hypothetical protein
VGGSTRWLISLSAIFIGCFSPDIGEGTIGCAPDGTCPPGFHCVNSSCFSITRASGDLSAIDRAGAYDLSPARNDQGGHDQGMPDLAGADLAGCRPNTSCNGFCGSMADGCGHSLSCGDCTAPNTCSAQAANSCACTPTTCDAAHIHCGRYPDGCGGTILTCASCGNNKICGTASQSYTCANKNQTPCKALTCQPGQCGIIPDGCNDVVDCHGCPAGQVCGGGGTPNVCG